MSPLALQPVASLNCYVVYSLRAGYSEHHHRTVLLADSGDVWLNFGDINHRVLGLSDLNDELEQTARESTLVIV